MAAPATTTLIGGAGEDTLAGGQGNDALAGGAGNDVFRFDFNNFGAGPVSALPGTVDGGAGADTLTLVNGEGTGVVTLALAPASKTSTPAA